MLFWLLPVIVLGPGAVAALVFGVMLVRSMRADRRRIERLERIAQQEHARRAVYGPNVIPIWQAPSLHREVTD